MMYVGHITAALRLVFTSNRVRVSHSLNTAFVRPLFVFANMAFFPFTLY